MIVYKETIKYQERKQSGLLIYKLSKFRKFSIDILSYFPIS